MAGGTGFTPAPPPSAPPAPPPTVRVGGHIRPPEKIHSVSPVYPAIAQQARLEGIVILEAVIAPDGTIRDVRTLRAHPIFEAAALEAVRQWRYRPTLLNGVPVNVIMTVTINFHLD
jgi:protein TonB